MDQNEILKRIAELKKTPGLTAEQARVLDQALQCVAAMEETLRLQSAELAGLKAAGGAELTARRREAYRLLDGWFQNLPPAVVRLEKGIIVFANNSVRRIFGLTPEEIIGKSYNIFHHSEAEFEQIDRELRSAMAQGGNFSREVQCLRKDGAVFTGLLRAWVPEASGEAELDLVTIYEDITDQKQAETALLDEQQRLTQIISFLPDATFAVDREGKVTAWNLAMEELTGVRAADMLGKGNYEYALPFYGDRRPILIDLVLHPDPEIEKQYAFFKRDKNTVLSEAEMRINGQWRILWAKVVPLYDSNGEIAGAIETIRDIVGHKLNLMFNHTFQLMALMTPEGVVMEVNKAALDMAGVPLAEVQEKFFWETSWWTHSEEAQQQIRQAVQAAAAGKTMRFETQHFSKNGDAYYVDFALTPVQDSENNVVFLIAEGRDITELKKVQNDLLEDKKRLKNLLDIYQRPDTQVKDLFSFVIEECIQMSKSRLGFWGLINEDETAMTVHFWSEAAMEGCAVDLRPVEFSLANAGIWAEAIKERKPLVINDYAKSDPRKKGYPEGHVEIRRFMSIPVIREGKAVAILAVANKDRDYDETDLLHLSLFIENIWDESKRKQAEGDLKREKEFLDNLIKTAPVIVLVLDIQGSIVSFNPYMEHLSGYLLDEVRGKNWFDTFLRKDDAAKIRDVFSQAIHDVDTQGNVNLIVAKNGREIIIEWDAKTLKDADGRVVGLLSVGQDITERDRAERELRWKTALLESQIEADIDGVLVVDSLGQRILVNSRLLEMWEVPERIRNDKLDAPLLEYVVGRTKNPEQFLAKVNYLYSHETETSRDEVEFKDGIIFDRYSSPVKDKQGAYLGRIWTFRDITERKRAETALKEIAGFLQHLIDAIPSPIFYKDTQGVYRGCNAAFEKYLGLPKEKIVGMSAHDLSPKELADKYLEMDLALLRQGGGQVYESKVQYADGTRHDVIFNKAVFVNVDGSLGGLVGVIIDITERKRAEDEVKSARVFLDRVIDMSPFAMWISDKEGTLIRANRSLCQAVNLSPDVFVGKYNVFKDVNLERQGVMPMVKAVIEKHVPVRFSIPWTAADAGSVDFDSGRDIYIDASMFPILDSQNELTNIVCQWVDITERKRAEQTLLQNMETINGILQAIPHAVVGLENRQVIFANDAVNNMFGYRPEEVLGQKTRIFYLSDEEFIRIGDTFYPMLEQYGTFTQEVTCRRKDGSTFPALLSASCIGGKLKDRRQVIAMYEDITGRKQAESALRGAEERLNQIISFLPDATFAVDLEGKIIAWNRAMEEMSGAKAADMLGKGDYEYAVPFYGKRRPLLIDLVFESDKDIVKNYSFVKKQENGIFAETTVAIHGVPRVLWGKAVALYDSSGTIIGAIEAIRDVTESRQAEQSILRNMETINGIMQAIPHVVVGLENRQVTFANDAVNNIFGYRPEEVLGQKTRIFYLSDEEFIRIGDTFYPMLEQYGTFTQEVTCRRKDGSTFPALLSASCIGGKLNERRQVIAMYEDITERKKAVEEIKSAADVWSNTFDSITDLVVIMDKNQVIMKINKAFRRVFNLTAEQIVGKKCYEIMHKAQTACPGCPFERMMREGTACTDEIDDPNLGIPLLESVSPLLNPSGEIIGAVHIARDISEERKARKELEKKMRDLETFYKIAVGRELKMIELKKQIASGRSPGQGPAAAKGPESDASAGPEGTLPPGKV